MKSGNHLGLINKKKVASKKLSMAEEKIYDILSSKGYSKERK